MAYAVIHYLKNVHVQLCNGARSLGFGLILYLLPNFVYANSEGPGDAARMRKLD